MRMRVLIVGAVIIVLAGGAMALRARGGGPAPTTQPAQVQVTPVSVEVVPARRAEFVTSVSATGTVASLREAKIASTLAGIVAEVFVAEGQRVARGAPLMRLRTDQLVAIEAQARAGEAQARAGLGLAETSVKRLRELYQIGAVSRQELDVAEAQFAAARAQLQLAEAALASARIQLRDATVTAPFAGTITQRSVEPGEGVSPVVRSFILAQLDAVYVELAVPERQRSGLRVGQTVAVTVDGLPGSQFAGKIEKIQPAETVSSRSFTVKVRVPNAQRVLRPGAFARGIITVTVRSGVLQIPEQAVLVTAGNPVLFVVQNDRAVRREVALGERQGGFVEITSGLAAGEVVIVNGQLGLTDNQLVAARASQP